MLLWAAGARRPEVEEALRPLGGHCMVSRARIVHIDLVDKALRLHQLSRPTSQPAATGSQLAGGIHFLCVIRRHFLACEDIAGGSDLSAGGTFFSRNTEALPTYSPRTVRNKEELSLRATMDLVGPSRQALHVQSSSDDSRMLTTPR